MFEVAVPARSVQPFEALLGPEPVQRVEKLAEEVRALLQDRAVLNISSTAVGGGVAEMLRSLLRYARGLGVQVRWLVVQGPPEFFRITKRLHNALHDTAGDGSPLGDAEAELYRRVSQENAAALLEVARPSDVVICHDPQTAGLVPHLVAHGTRVIWRCHIGHEGHGVEVDRGWDFLRACLDLTPLAVFSRAAYAPDWLPRARAVVLPPNIDPFSAKNQVLDDETTRGILVQSGLVAGTPGEGRTTFTRDDGSTGRVDRVASVLRVGGPPARDTPLIVQVSRWDRMKDPLGILEGFARLTDSPAHLVLAGPETRSVSDDPEGPAVLAEVQRAWNALSDERRSKAHLAELPMGDREENAAIVNALQRHAAIIIQKSLREGFGLTVTEAMWKHRPVIASAVGGIQDQIRDGIEGILIHDPTDPAELVTAIRRVLGDPALAERLGVAGHARVRNEYLTLRSLEHWAQLIRLVVPT